VYSLAAALLGILGCVDWTGPKRFVSDLDVSGTVISSRDGSPIPNATVRLGQGGSFFFPTELEATQADAAAQYRMTHSITYDDEWGCPVLWIVAEAAGFQTSHREDSRHTVECTSTPQTIEVTLDPVP
jgi:hypothetical protein